jgi:hypothetical protein
MALKRVWIPSPNYSSRAGSKVRLIVLHTAEGASTYQNLGSYFANPKSQVSSHVGIDDTPGTVGEYVKRENKAWTAANANPYSIQAELCAWASWTIDQWATHPMMLQNCAQWIAEEATYYNIPIVRLSPQQVQSGGTGVCEHVDLGTMGGNHYDCGPNFPIDQVISQAKSSTGGGTTTGGGAVEICSTPSGKGYWVCGSDGGIFTYGDAQFYGSLGNTPLAAPIVGMCTTPTGKGYWLLGKDGGVFTFGDAVFYGAPTGLVK